MAQQHVMYLQQLDAESAFVDHKDWKDCIINVDVSGAAMVLEDKPEPNGQEPAPARKSTVGTFHFPQGRSVNFHGEVGKALSKEPVAAIAQRAMLDFHRSGLRGDEIFVTPPEDRGPTFFMLCDDEEIEVGDDGSMDGSLRSRRRCVEWSLTYIHSEKIPVAFVEFGGSLTNGEYVGRGYLIETAPNVAHGLTAAYDVVQDLPREDQTLDVCQSVKQAAGLVAKLRARLYRFGDRE